MDKILIILFIIISNITCAQFYPTNRESLSAQFSGNILTKVGESLSIYEIGILNFGSMNTPNGPVILRVSTNNIRTAIPSNNITLLYNDLYSCAQFTVYGSKNSHYMVIIPLNNIVQISNGSSSIPVNNFTIKSNSNNGNGNWSGKLNQLGTDSFTIGADLILSNGQENGRYIGTYNLIVSYN